MKLDDSIATANGLGVSGPAVRSRSAKLLGIRNDPESVAELWTEQLWQRTFVRGLIAVDAFTVVAGAAASALFRSYPGTGADWVIAAASVLAWSATLAAARVYEMRYLGLGTDEFKRIFVAGACLTTLFTICTIHATAVDTRILTASTTAGLTALLLAERGVCRGLLHAKRRRGGCLHRVVVMGTTDNIDSLIADIDRVRISGWDVVAACLLGEVSQRSITIRGRTLPVGMMYDAVAMAALHGADTIAVTDQHLLPKNGLRQLAWDLEGTAIQLLISSTLTDVAAPRVTVRALPNLPLLHVDQPQFSGAQRVYKSATDRAIALVALLVLSPVLAAIALAVKLGDPGPVFFRQERIGRGGERFSCFKFRSMCQNAEDMFIDLSDGGVMFKVKGDLRITRVGAFLRRASLDELPQLINVLRGDMSLVGPRPQVQTEVDVYETHHHRRLLVKPGMTGLWQVNGRSDLTWAEAVRLDLYYVENWSPLLDLRILAKTIGAVAKGSGAY